MVSCLDYFINSADPGEAVILMKTRLPFTILAQPTETTCGPTCLHAVYNYYDDCISLDRVVHETPVLQDGGTLAVFLGCHALSRGYKVTIYTYNLQLFDPVWFENPGTDIGQKLKSQSECKKDPKLQEATKGYLEFLLKGGKVHLQDLSASLIRKHLRRGVPIITGLSATYLHRSPREVPSNCEYDDVGGYPSGHFVVLCGYNKEEKTVTVAEPLYPNPVSSGQYYKVRMERVICSILLGIVTYDANLLIIEKPQGRHGKPGSSK